jgi:hypothetical protein
MEFTLRRLEKRSQTALKPNGERKTGVVAMKIPRSTLGEPYLLGD